MVDEILKPTQANGSMDYEGMTKMIKYLLDAAWGSEWGNFTPEGPNATDETNVEYPYIIHHLSEMVPGLIGKNTREIKPRIRYQGRNDEVNGSGAPGASVYGQIFDAEVVFEIWEETNEKVDKLTKEFRQFLSIYKGYLKQRGLKELSFVKMETDLSNNRIKDAYQIRKLVYFVKFEELTVVPTDVFFVIETIEKRLQEELNNQNGV